MARKNYPDEFKRDAVTLYRDTVGATLTQIAADLGVSGVTLSAWCKSAGVPIRHRNPTPEGGPAAGVESPDQELARLRAEVGRYGLMRPDRLPSVTFCGRRPSISPGRRTGEPLPVRCRPPGRL